MPYTEKQERLFRAVKHGWKPDNPKIKLTPAKAGELLEHSKTKRQGESLRRATEA